MNIEEVVRNINATPYKVYVALAGGGQTFASEFMQFGGASKTIAGINIPYGKEAFEEFCGTEVKQFVNPDTARLLAKRSYEKCLKSVEDPQYAIGIGLTCSLATDNEREGRQHRIYVALHCEKYTVVSESIFEQGLTREQEEEYCFITILNCLSHAAGVPVNFEDQMQFFIRYIPYMTNATGNLNMVLQEDLNTTVADDIDYLVLAPGSFNPFHDGHKAMMDMAYQILGTMPRPEITMYNADKGVLDYIDVKQRIDTIADPYKLNTIVTKARTFLDKARQFAKEGRQIVFVIGADTWNRLLNPTYAGDMPFLYSNFVNMNVTFLVFNRAGATISTDPIMDQLRKRHPQALKFNVSMSSTEIRERS